MKVKKSNKLPKRLFLIGSIDDALYSKFTEELYELEQEGVKEVEVELVSGGGDAAIALAFFHRIKTTPVKIIMVARGSVESAAVLILAAGHYRKISEQAYAMVHEDSVSKYSDNASQMKVFSKHLDDMEDKWARLLELATTTKQEVWREMHRETTYLTSRDCLRYGLVDEVV